MGREFVLIRGRAGEMATPGEESIWKYLETRDEEKSVLWLHSLHHHQGRVDVVYRMRTTGSYADPLDRQLQERVNITNFKGPILMNRRNEMGGVRVDRMRYRRWGDN